MERQDTLRNLLIAASIFVLVMAFAPRLIPLPSPPTGQDGRDVSDSGAPSGLPQAPPGEDRPTATTAGAGAPAEGGEKVQARFTVVQAPESREFALGAAPGDGADTKAPPAPYRMRVVLSNVGASIDSTTLTDHAAELNSSERYALLSPIERPSGHVYRSLAVEMINVDGEVVRLDDKRWHASEVEPYSAEGGEGQPAQEGERLSFWVEMQKGDEPALKVTRTFMLPRQPVEDGRHDLWSTITVANLSSESHSVLLSYRGGLGVPQSRGRMAGRMLDVGVRTEENVVAGSRSVDSKLASAPSRRLSLYQLDASTADQRLAWAAVGNTYFTCTVAPVGADGRSVSTYISEVAAYDADGSDLTKDDTTITFVTIPSDIDPGGKITYRAALYLGEKDAKSFRKESDYAARNYYYQISQSFGMCTFTWLVELMISLLNGLFFVVRDFGVAIIILVLIVRTLLHPITKKGQVNMVRMQKQMGELSPKLEEIKKKYANDKARLQQETMKLYREQGVNPAGQMLTCLPMVIQMPIWVALFLSLSNNILMRHEPFLFTWVHDLTAPDAMYTFAAPLTVPLFGWKIASFNLLPLLVAVFMYIQQKTQPRPKPNPNMSEQQRSQQEMMQKMMPMMSIMMLLIFYNMPSGLNLYIMCSSMFGWMEQMRIRKHIKEHEERDALHKPSVGDGGGPGGLKAPDASRGPRRRSWLDKLQKAAEEAQKSQRTHRKPKPRR